MTASKLLKKHFPSLYKKLARRKNEKLYQRNRKWAESGHPELIINYMYNRAFGENPNLESPVTFNEKLQWLKLNWYDEHATICSSKHRVRSFVEEKGLGHILIPQYGAYRSASEIDFDSLPDKFVLKPSHDSGHVIICTDKNSFDRKEAVKNLDNWMKIDYEFMSGEWPYHGPRCIVCEAFLENKKTDDLFDYKFFCFSGEPFLCFFCSDRKNHAKSDFYDMNWEKQNFRWLYEPSGKTFPKPETFEKMKEYARILSEGFPFVRVDFYEVDGKIFFGELTFFHGGGLGWFEPKEIDRLLGDKITLPEKASPGPWEIILRK